MNCMASCMVTQTNATRTLSVKMQLMTNQTSGSIPTEKKVNSGRHHDGAVSQSFSATQTRVPYILI